MLSRNNIYKELGKNINFYPFNSENIKENSVNLTIGSNSWTKGNGTVYWYGGDNFSLVKNTPKPKATKNFKSGENCVFQIENNTQSKRRKKEKFIILLPHSTTIIETSEVVGIGDKIGGTFHSKVGIVAKGVGHIGTMLGPGFCGHLMISVHNITDNVIALKVGSTFVSLCFHYLDSRVSRTSSTISGHVDKFASLGINIDEATSTYLTEDWKSDIKKIKNKMEMSDNYKQFKKQLQKQRCRDAFSRFTWIGVLKSIIVLSFLFLIYYIAYRIDCKNGNSVWTERYLTIGCSGILIPIFTYVFKNLFGD